MTANSYTGRFAPSPTGPLHFGSLVTATASYFQAKSKKGKWLVRIEDIDKEREQQGASTLILNALEAHHFFWDDDIVYQSNRQEYYQDAIQKLNKLNITYRCQCSRKSIQQYLEKHKLHNSNSALTIYPGICRNKNIHIKQSHTLRLLVHDQEITFTDTIQGKQVSHTKYHGDFILQKRDGSVTYQLAVAIDDVQQNITEVVRGFDLIDSSSKQILIQSLLNHPIPKYCHLPIIGTNDGTKLSKHNGAKPLENHLASSQLWKALSYLKQYPPLELKSANIQELHNWATQNWDINRISNKHNFLIYK
ncbi:Glutamyl-Q tRNA(Asp) synthetase [hydrothermal vent metagenome]|uniref:Glutamyl-Q tRNA(Asp) synthetase n=1 Tax=hydrothermal vent metagenome TaxID=652676 RepID=A0A3B0ZP07_9ZZZZ